MQHLVPCYNIVIYNLIVLINYNSLFLKLCCFWYCLSFALSFPLHGILCVLHTIFWNLFYWQILYLWRRRRKLWLKLHSSNKTYIQAIIRRLKFRRIMRIYQDFRNLIEFQLRRNIIQFLGNFIVIRSITETLKPLKETTSKQLGISITKSFQMSHLSIHFNHKVSKFPTHSNEFYKSIFIESIRHIISKKVRVSIQLDPDLNSIFLVHILSESKHIGCQEIYQKNISIIFRNYFKNHELFYNIG